MRCQHCGQCCGEDRRININLSVGDIFRICNHLKISVDVFFEKYAGVKEFKDPKQGDYPDLGLDIPCKFRKDNRCSVYEARPVNCRIFPYWVLALVPEENLKEVLKNNKCKYDLGKKEVYRKYQAAIAKILLEEAKWFELDKELDISKIKEVIARNLFRISKNSKELEKAENILNDSKDR